MQIPDQKFIFSQINMGSNFQSDTYNKDLIVIIVFKQNFENLGELCQLSDFLINLQFCIYK